MSKRYNFPEWLNKSKFDRRQLEQIKEGIKSGLDTSIYAKPEFDADQMYEIKQGLKTILMSPFMQVRNLVGDKCTK